MISMYRFCEDLFPFNRSLMGNGNLATLEYIKRILPNLSIHSLPTGFRAYDWEVPDEWELEDAYVEDLSGKRLIDVSKSNLHVVGYSISINEIMNFATLRDHLFTHEAIPHAIPYLTTYYNRTWGFCLSKNQLEQFNEKDEYRVVINSRHYPGYLHSGELILKGSTTKEILLSTYICHPSLGNNELSGPAVLTALTSWISNLEDRHFTYRITFHSETLGALCFLKTYESEIKENVLAAWNFTCMGGPGDVTMLPSQYRNTLGDKVTLEALKKLRIEPKMKSFLSRGSDERQFSSPRIRIPMISIMKSAYGEYAEYHSSDDDLTYISEESMSQSLNIMKEVIRHLEKDKYYRQTFIGEPHLNKYGLYPTLLDMRKNLNSRDILNVIQFCDGTNNIREISDQIGVQVEDVERIIDILIAENIIE